MEPLASLLRLPADTETPKPLFNEGAYEAIVSLWEKSAFDKAANAAASLWNEGIHDIRLAVYCLHGHFVETGPAGVPALLDALEALLKVRGDSIGPLSMRTQHFDKRLEWLFRVMAENLRARGTPATLEGRWNEAFTEPLKQACLARTDDLLSLFSERNLTGATSSLVVFVHELRALPTSDNEDPRTGRDQPPDFQTASTPRNAPLEPLDRGELTPIEALSPEERSVSLDVSPHFVALCAKLRVFQALATKGSYKRAAIVADDVNKLLESFDPVLYFPALFRSYFRALSGHVSELAPYWEEREGLEWSLLSQLYRTDLDGFADLEAEASPQQHRRG